MAVKEELRKLGLHFIVVDLGEVEIMENISSEQREQMKAALLISTGTVHGKLVAMPNKLSGDCTAIISVMRPPQSPPCAKNLSYPSRFINVTQAYAMRDGPQPVVLGFPENP